LSVTVNYFFNYDKELPELAEELNSWLGCSLAPLGTDDEISGEDQNYLSSFLAMGLWLSKCEFKNDGECNFEDYQYELNTRTRAGDADLRIMQIPTTALIAYSLYRRMGIVGMLVFDGMTLLARYEERLNPRTNKSHLYDVVSGEFVEFPAHFMALANRVTGNC
jgi:hypothetical protein